MIKITRDEYEERVIAKRERSKVVAIETERERSADNVATMDWLIPFHHTEHCALDADKNTQSNKQKEKRETDRERGENLTQFYLDDTKCVGREGKSRRDGRQKGKYTELKNGV